MNWFVIGFLVIFGLIVILGVFAAFFRLPEEKRKDPVERIRFYNRMLTMRRTSLHLQHQMRQVLSDERFHELFVELKDVAK